MSRYEQRRELGVQAMLEQRKVKFNPNNAVVYLENVGNPSDLLRQQNLYWKEGYDTLHEDGTGVFMHIPRSEVSANEKRYQTESRERLRRPAPAGLAKEFHEEGNKAEYAAPVTGEDFLNGPGD